MKQCDISGGSKHTLTHRTYFQGGSGPPSSRAPRPRRWRCVRVFQTLTSVARQLRAAITSVWASVRTLTARSPAPARPAIACPATSAPATVCTVNRRRLDLSSGEKDRTYWWFMLMTNVKDCRGICMGGATRGVGGTMSPTFGTSGVQGYRGVGRSNENDLCFYSRQSLFSTVQVTEFQVPWL